MSPQTGAITNLASQNAALKILRNLVIDRKEISCPDEGMCILRGKEKRLEAIHIYLENISPDVWRKKGYFEIHRVSTLSRLDAWIYAHLVEEDKYREYLNRYLLQKDKLNFKDVDEFILTKHYRRKAIGILSLKLKNFDLNEWQKPRFRYDYKRKTNLMLKDGQAWEFDFRNILESFFICKEGKDKHILARGDSGSSYQRNRYTVFTVIFHNLGKRVKIKHHLLKYNSFNELEYIKTFTRPIVTFDLGSNYQISKRLWEEIQETGVSFEDIRGLCPADGRSQ